MAASPLLELSAVDLGLAYRRGDASPREAVGECLARIEEVNPKLNAFSWLYPDDALDRAKLLEDELSAGRDRGPLHGIPIAIKESMPIAGKPTTYGSLVYKDHISEESSVVIERLVEAGAIIVGKTTCPEFGNGWITRSRLWGETRNPWDLGRTPGGSSGGAAAAVAARCVPIAQGSDAGGSIRCPAAYCNVVGFMPSLGRIPVDSMETQFDTTVHVGPLTRTVDDAALFLDATQGPSDRDIQSLPFLGEIPKALEADLSGIRLGVCIDLGYLVVPDDIRACMLDAVEGLKEAGAVVDEVTLGWGPHLQQMGDELWAVLAAAEFAPLLDQHRDAMEPEFVRMIEQAPALSAVHFKRLELARTAAWKGLAHVLRDHDALISAAMPITAPALGGPFWQESFIDENGRYHSMDTTSPFNLFGQCPCASFPAGFAKDGLPVGLHVCGRRYEDVAVMRIGKALETARPHARRSPLLAQRSQAN